MPHREVRVKGRNGEPATYSGVNLQDVLREAGVTFGGPHSNADALSLCVVVEAADGYQAVSSVAELDEALSGRSALLAGWWKEPVDGSGNYRGPGAHFTPASGIKKRSAGTRICISPDMPEYTFTTSSVLIVEDDSGLSRALQRIIEQRGIKVELAGTVADALEKLDCCGRMLLDMNLPDGLGTEVLERIRAERRPVKVAVLTGTLDTELLGRARELRPDAVFIKPITAEALEAWLSSSNG
jgi:CheY-like chemotaxis protein